MHPSDGRNPMVSIILPTYNRARLLGQAIDSLQVQTYTDFEIIVVDDGSTDETPSLLKAWRDKAPGLRSTRHQVNRGISAARNTGIRMSRGEFIAFQDSDDLWRPDKLARQMALFAGAPDDVGVVYSRFVWRLGGKAVVGPPLRRLKQGYVHRDLLRGNFVDAPTAVVRRAALDRVGLFDESLPSFEDWDLFLRISKGYAFRLVDAPLVTSSALADGLSANREAYLRAYRILLTKYHRDFRRAAAANPLRIKMLLSALLPLTGEPFFSGLLRIRSRLHMALRVHPSEPVAASSKT